MCTDVPVCAGGPKLVEWGGTHIAYEKAYKHTMLHLLPRNSCMCHHLLDSFVKLGKLHLHKATLWVVSLRKMGGDTSYIDPGTRVESFKDLVDFLGSNTHSAHACFNAYVQGSCALKSPYRYRL